MLVNFARIMNQEALILQLVLADSHVMQINHVYLQEIHAIKALVQLEPISNSQ
jgi:hypothetical protein